MKKLGQKGQSSVEYLLIVAVLVGAIFAFGDQLKSGFTNLTQNVFGSLTTKITERINKN